MLNSTTVLWIVLLAVVLSVILMCALKNKDSMKNIEMPPIGQPANSFSGPAQLSLSQWYRLCQFGDRSPDSVVVENDIPAFRCSESLQNGMAADQFNANEGRRVQCEKLCNVGFKRYRSPEELSCVSQCYWGNN